MPSTTPSSSRSWTLIATVPSGTANDAASMTPSTFDEYQMRTLPCGLAGRPFFIAFIFVKKALDVAKSAWKAPGPFGSDDVGAASPHAARTTNDARGKTRASERRTVRG